MSRQVAQRHGWRGSAGFTTAEVVVAVGILSLALGLVGSSIFQALSIQRSWRDDVVATRELRHAGSWFAGDALNATFTDLADGGPSASSVTLSWADKDGVSHTSTYLVSASTLVRDHDGAPLPVARRVVSAAFSRSGRMLTFSLEVQADRDATRLASLQTYLRMLQ